MKNRFRLSSTTTVREPFNTFSHAAGAVLGLVGMVALLFFTQGNAAKIVGALVFGLTMILMYTSSALYHALRVSERALLWLRKLDHAAIFLFIAGTYTPVLLQAMEPAWRPWALGLVWGLASLGVGLKLVTLKAPRWLYTATYLGMGWLSVFLLPKLALNPLALGFLIAGGVAYSLGAVVYAAKWPNLLPRLVGFHGLWHVFVLLGSAGMYFAVLSLYIA
ncbi:MAG: hemolysin [Meiothermus sp.]|uniref:Hemolysin n=2 Tax=Meiothermus hypogaeus TaxID=884155 RepID=A0A511R4F4_9DEIN|nr:hemolysin III family protein [Meiothermus hypogaeus]RIH78629.1 channel protein, hemolysin III family [Meiothermus hypogaeus]GEM84490.1 hemolysin [Meiothermus hypogaeus NBRC 106114]GIW38218.1 MAG: hemolysin [Meiothermus sp.]